MGVGDDIFYIQMINFRMQMVREFMFQQYFGLGDVVVVGCQVVMVEVVDVLFDIGVDDQVFFFFSNEMVSLVVYGLNMCIQYFY